MSAPSASSSGSTLQQVAAGAAEAATKTGEPVKVEATSGGRRRRGGAVLSPLPLGATGGRRSRKGGRKSRRGGQEPEMAAPVAGRRRKSRKGGKSRRH